MKIAVTYKDGEVFQHFGKSEEFKIYTVVDDEVTASEVVKTDGSGHGELVNFLKEKGVNVLICGGIGMGARNALEETTIQMFAGASGNADEQAEAFINGKLHFETTPSCCSHHGENGEACEGFVGKCGHNCFENH